MLHGDPGGTEFAVGSEGQSKVLGIDEVQDVPPGHAQQAVEVLGNRDTRQGLYQHAEEIWRHGEVQDVPSKGARNLEAWEEQVLQMPYYGVQQGGL